MASQVIQKTPTGFVYEVQLKNGSARFEFRKVHEDGEALKSFLTVTILHPTFGNFVPFMGNFNISATNTRKTLSKYVRERAELLKNEPWDDIIESACQHVIESFYNVDEKPERLTLTSSEIEYLMYPILPKNHCTLVYAPGGSGKSLLALYFAMLLQNGMRLEKEKTDPVESLYLDWEVDRQEADRRAKGLSVNFENQSLQTPFYRRCVLPLRDELDAILLMIAQHSIQFVVIDSVGPSLGSDINDASSVVEYFSCIRQITSLGATVLLLSHVSKAAKEKDDATPIGSVYFENFPRLTWELKYEFREETLNIALFVRKCNFKRPNDIGFKIVFEGSNIYVFLSEPDVTTDEVTKSQMVRSFLAKNGPSTVDTIVKLGLSKNEVWNVLKSLKRREIVDTTEDGKWKLTTQSDVPF
ncbi:MAG TPA: AAA family ATPase [Pseudothermotoga sp.]|nr:AAA family ATPase [Pseudothermotoga sp.]HOK84676.1 AAA family ATPase [Pseudothermotoga sp.]HPP71203.1 AAA family ATPase [Pseudothermotoga sp.]